MMCRWDQELLDDHFSIIHRSARMMIDVDGLTRRFCGVMAQYFCVAALLHKYDIMKRPQAYDQQFRKVEGAASIAPSPFTSDIDIPILTSVSIDLCRTNSIATTDLALVTIPSVPSKSPPAAIRSVLIMLRHSPTQSDNSILLDAEDTALPLLKISQNAICTWMCIDDVLSSFLSWYKYGNCGLIE